MTSRPKILATLAAVALAAAMALALAGPRAGRADPGLDGLRSEAHSRRARERSLAADVARLGRIEARVETQLAALQRRRAEVQADLDADHARLAGLQSALRAERARLIRLRGRLAQDRRVLAQRLLALYQAPSQDLVTVVLGARSLAELVDRGEFLRLIHEQDRRIIHTVRAARADAAAAAARMATAQARLRGAIAAVTARRNALASMSTAVEQRRATLRRTRAIR